MSRQRSRGGGERSGVVVPIVRPSRLVRDARRRLARQLQRLGFTARDGREITPADAAEELASSALPLTPAGRRELESMMQAISMLDAAGADVAIDASGHPAHVVDARASADGNAVRLDITLDSGVLMTKVITPNEAEAMAADMLRQLDRRPGPRGARSPFKHAERGASKPATEAGPARSEQAPAPLEPSVFDAIEKLRPILWQLDRPDADPSLRRALAVADKGLCAVAHEIVMRGVADQSSGLAQNGARALAAFRADIDAMWRADLRFGDPQRSDRGVVRAIAKIVDGVLRSRFSRTADRRASLYMLAMAEPLPETMGLPSRVDVGAAWRRFADGKHYAAFGTTKRLGLIAELARASGLDVEAARVKELLREPRRRKKDGG